MATAKPKTNPEPVEEPVEEYVEETPALVTIRLPIDREDKEDKVVWVNERRFLIKRGVPVTVPYEVADILRKEEEAQQLIYDYEDRVSR